MVTIEGFKNYFIADFKQRAKSTLEKAAFNDFEHLN